MKNLMKVLILATVIPIITACPIIIDDDIDPELIEKRDAYYSVIEAHSLKQEWIYDYFKLYSNNYMQNQLFVHQPNQLELDAYWSDFSELMNFSKEIDEALTKISFAGKELYTVNETKRLKSINSLTESMSTFFIWAEQASQQISDATLMFVNEIGHDEKSQLFNEYLRTVWKNNFTSETGFWNSFQSGELNDKAFSIFNDFYFGSLNSSNNNFNGVAESYGYTPDNIATLIGAVGVINGSDVYVQSTKHVRLNQNDINLAQSTINFGAKIGTAANAQPDMLGEEIKNRIKSKLNRLISLESGLDIEQFSNNIGLAGKMLCDASTSSSNPSIISAQNPSWGITKIKSPDKSIIPEVILAESNNSVPKIILGVGSYVNTADETLLSLPDGEWKITIIDKYGSSAQLSQVQVQSGQFSEVIVTGDDKENVPDEDENEDNGSADNNLLGKYQAFTDFEIEFRPDVVVTELNNLDLVFPGTYENQRLEKGTIEWDDNTFKSEWSIVEENSSKNTKLEQSFVVSGEITIAAGMVHLSLFINSRYYWNNNSYHILEQNWSINLWALNPLESNYAVFEISAANTPDYFSDVELYLGYSFMNDYASTRDKTNIEKKNEFGNDPYFKFTFK